MPEQQPSDLEDLPPSAKLVYKILEYEDRPLPTPEIADEAHLPESTVRHAIRRLDDADTIVWKNDLSSPGRKVYYLDR
ncbi:helix-turn-helix domain-containing protein [Natrarchaeobaculum sulfurireducens]|uniref:Transcriptional regulator containing HTH domain,ArsR family n=1 Tax=Natrarchaeobaculum sulfurireducens TaxID=2044521 RepID=A0A346PHL2_9EURY|nr:ArsR family transcriptional regulator [Natrarchaeobaculum sulfurireducens]AXR79007.1 Transcriptional regulator containing HTH domain,ArsR family [Natrarchaeobaculum sulfurireducens]